MDAHIGRAVFENVFKGLLKSKTRIFCTNQLHFCEDCDRVYMLADGAVVESGTYKELSNKGSDGKFSVFLQSMVGAEEKEVGAASAEGQTVEADIAIATAEGKPLELNRKEVKAVTTGNAIRTVEKAQE